MKVRSSLPSSLLATLTATLPATLAAALVLGPAQPCGAIETIQLKIPLLETSFTLRLSELADPTRLFDGTSDFAEINRATGGKLGQQLRKVLNTPLPLPMGPVLRQSVGTPLLEQALLVLSTLGTVHGQPPDLSGRLLQQALETVVAQGHPTVLTLLRAIPGDSVSVDLGGATSVLERLVAQQRLADRLLAKAPAATAPLQGSFPGPLPVRERSAALTVSHRSVPLQVVLVEPAQGGNGRLVLISHGLWDSPASFLGWARVLASRGYTVLLPIHPGSDKSEQQAMLSGKAPPPSAAELRLRPLDLKRLMDGAAAAQLGLAAGTDASKVVVVGHSWGATSALQLAGVRPSSNQLVQRCLDTTDADRNLSWTLQCSWKSAADEAALADPRVIAVAAVSPPTHLLFDYGAARDLSGRVLLVSGSRDWVVPPGPEAIEPFRGALGQGHQLVLAEGGDHFNLRPLAAADGGVLGALLVAWVEGSFAAGEGVRPGRSAPPLLPPGGWGHAAMPLVDVTGQLSPL